MVNLLGIVAVYCDPDTYPLVPPVHTGVRMAIALHTRQIPNFTNSAEIHLGNFLAGSFVMSLCEVGLDLMETGSVFRARNTLNYFLSRYCCSSRTLVLHIRGNNSSHGLALYFRAFTIVKEHCGVA